MRRRWAILPAMRQNAPAAGEAPAADGMEHKKLAAEIAKLKEEITDHGES